MNLISLESYLSQPQQLDIQAQKGKYEYAEPEFTMYSDMARDGLDQAHIWSIVSKYSKLHVNEARRTVSGRELMVLNASASYNFLSSLMLFWMFERRDDIIASPCLSAYFCEIISFRKQSAASTSEIDGLVKDLFKMFFSDNHHITFKSISLWARNQDLDELERIIHRSRHELPKSRYSHFSYLITTNYAIFALIFGGRKKWVAEFLQSNPFALRPYPWLFIADDRMSGLDRAFSI